MPSFKMGRLINVEPDGRKIYKDDASGHLMCENSKDERDASPSSPRFVLHVPDDRRNAQGVSDPDSIAPRDVAL